MEINEVNGLEGRGKSENQIYSRPDSSYHGIAFKPFAYLREGGQLRKFVIYWLLLTTFIIPSSLLTELMGWTGIPIDLAGTTVYISLYIPLILCIPLVAWTGYFWGAIPAYFATFVVALYGGMDLPWIFVFSLANPLGLLIFMMVYRVVELRTDLRDLQAAVGFFIVSLLASLAGSTGSFVWAHTTNSGLNAAYPVWQGWWLGGWIQSVFIVAPLMWLIGPKVLASLNSLKSEVFNQRDWIRGLLFAMVGSLTVLMGYLAAARTFSIAEFQLAIEGIDDPLLRSHIANAIDGMSYPLFVLAAVIVAVAFFCYKAVTHWNRTLLQANKLLGNQNLQLQELASQLDERRQEAEAESMEKSRFLANMSHEIRTPMNGILGMLGLLRERKLEEKEMEFVKMAQTSANNLMLIINDILDVSKINSGKMQLEQVNLDFDALLDEVLGPFRFQVEDKGLKFSLNREGLQVTRVQGDPVRVRQIITNLVGNALKFTKEGEIEVTALSHAVKQDVLFEIQIRDTGIGIDKKDQELLFDAFTQADQSTTRNYGGSGLGLAISKQLAELMGGDIRIESERDKGSTFIVTMMLQERLPE